MLKIGREETKLHAERLGCQGNCMIPSGVRSTVINRTHVLNSLGLEQWPWQTDHTAFK